MRTLLLCLLLSANAQAAAPAQAPPLRECPPQAPPLRPDPSQKTELRLYNGVIYEVPVEAHWESTPNYKVLHRLSNSPQPRTVIDPADCPTGF